MYSVNTCLCDRLVLASSRGLIIVVLLVFAGCGGSSKESNSVTEGTTHPTAENIPSDDEVDHLISMRGASGAGGDLQEVVLALRSARKTLTLGVPEGEREEMIGKVEDVAVDEDGNVYVLDARNNEVKIYDAEGHFERVFGGPGRGPVEFMAPRLLSIDARGRLVVADRRAPIKVFEPRDTTYAYRNSIRVTASPEGLCVMNGRLYWQGLTFEEASEERGTIHAVSMTGELIGRFGYQYKSGNALVRGQLSMGHVACSKVSHTVVLGFHSLPMLYGYSADGQKKWVTKFEDFKQARHVEAVRGGRRGVLNDPTPASTGGESDIVWTLAAAPNGYVVAQLARRNKASLQARKFYAELHTYVIDGATGEGMYVGDSLPKIYEVTREKVYAGRNDPFPQVVIYEFKESMSGI